MVGEGPGCRKKLGVYISDGTPANRPPFASALVIVQGNIAPGIRLYGHEWAKRSLPPAARQPTPQTRRGGVLTGSPLHSLIPPPQHHAHPSNNAKLLVVMDTPLPRLSRWSAKDPNTSRFDNSESNSALVGPKPRGHIQVDCHFMFQQSKWGTLTKAKHPGGIVYIDLDFHQPRDCRLKSATVRLTLDDEDPALARFFPGERKTPGLPETSVNILRHGPTHFCGPQSQAYKITRHSALPRLEVGGFAGAGGLGRESERHALEVAR